MTLYRSLWNKGCLILLSLMLSLTVFIGLPSNTASAAVADDFQVSVMGPLAKINDWSSFKKQLQSLKSSGVYAIQKFKDADLDLTFTALEMNDSGTAPNYYLPSTLVDTISSIAKA